MVVIFLQMPEQVQKGRIRRIAVKYVLVVRLFRTGCVQNVAKQFFAKCLQQKILCLEMGIKGGSADIRPAKDLLHRNMGKILLCQQGDKGIEDGCPGFSLSSVHSIHRTIFKICSVTNDGQKISVADRFRKLHNNIEHSVL